MKKLLLVLIAIFVGLIAIMFFTDTNDRRARIDQAKTPEQFADAFVYGSGKTHATLKNGVLDISHDVDAILTAGTVVNGFNAQIARVIPTIFAKFPQVDSIIYRESGPFQDIKGNESREEMLRISFMRMDSDQIHWDKISYDNIPKLGEHYWMHPGLRRAITPERQ